MSVRTHHPWPSLIVSLLGIAVGSSLVTKAVGAARSDKDLLIGLICLVLGIVGLLALCHRWDPDRH